MGMESVYKLSVLLNVVDNLSGQMNTIQGNVSGSIQKLDSAFGTMQKAGAALTGVGGAILGVGTKLVTSTFDTQNALGELSSLGVKDLKAVEDAAKSFSDTWAGTSKADFITASYDIKSGIASLTDEGVAQFTQLAALTGKATKSTTEEMGSLFATGYGIYKGAYDDLSDLEFGEMFSAGIATAVKNYKTSGSEMASAISALGATATNNNVPLEEQLAILGQLQTTMSGSEAATKYKSFLNQATKAGEALGLQLTDDNNQLLSTPEILEKLKGKYGETIDAVEKKELKDAFGTDEAVAMIDLLYNNVDTLTTGVDDLSASMKQGSSVTQEMAEAINNTPEQKFQVLKQQIHNNVEELGSGLLPAVNDTMDKVSGLIKRGGEWISNNQQTVQTIMNIAMKLGVFLVVAGSGGKPRQAFLVDEEHNRDSENRGDGTQHSIPCIARDMGHCRDSCPDSDIRCPMEQVGSLPEFLEGTICTGSKCSTASMDEHTACATETRTEADRTMAGGTANHPDYRKGRSRCPDCPRCHICRGDTGSTLSTDPSDQRADKLHIIRDQRGECSRCAIPGRFFRGSRLCISRSR